MQPNNELNKVSTGDVLRIATLIMQFVILCILICKYNCKNQCDKCQYQDSPILQDTCSASSGRQPCFCPTFQIGDSVETKLNTKLRIKDRVRQ